MNGRRFSAARKAAIETPPRLLRAARAFLDLIAADRWPSLPLLPEVAELRAAVAEAEEGGDIARAMAESIAGEYTGNIRRRKGRK